MRRFHRSSVLTWIFFALAPAAGGTDFVIAIGPKSGFDVKTFPVGAKKDYSAVVGGTARVLAGTARDVKEDDVLILEIGPHRSSCLYGSAKSGELHLGFDLDSSVSTQRNGIFERKTYETRLRELKLEQHFVFPRVLTIAPISVFYRRRADKEPQLLGRATAGYLTPGVDGPGDKVEKAAALFDRFIDLRGESVEGAAQAAQGEFVSAILARSLTAAAPPPKTTPQFVAGALKGHEPRADHPKLPARRAWREKDGTVKAEAILHNHGPLPLRINAECEASLPQSPLFGQSLRLPADDGEVTLKPGERKTVRFTQRASDKASPSTGVSAEVLVWSVAVAQ